MRTPGHELDRSATRLSHEQTIASDTDEARGGGEALGQGSLIGRYVTLYRLGSGGMGVVFAAYDPQLDRKVAIKLLKGRSDRASQRLQREAQALAKLDHPNVVSVHDVGVHDGQLFVAMEFVAGRTLGEWLRERPRPWSELLAVFIAAGRGLAAAHEAGLIHRDFKPDNVMIGDDGRVRVMDFGLARTDAGAGEPEPPRSELAELDGEPGRLTRTGALMGTPAYMSLEQFEAAEVDARSDQFSFCVALYEALYGARPFAADSLADLIAALAREQIAPAPAAAKVPAWLRRHVVRGLAKDRERRWPSMAALLDALADDPAPRRRRRVAAGLLLALLGGASWAVAAQMSADREVCRSAERELLGAWDAQRRVAVEQALLGPGSSHARETWARVEQHLDGYADAWIAGWTDACEATQRGEQSSALLDLRMACLDERREQLAATVDVLAEADAGVVEHAVEAVLALPSLDRCGDARALLDARPSPDDPALAEQVAAIEQRLAVVAALHAAGRYADALALADELAEVAQALDYEPLLARIRLRQGHLRERMGDYEGAEAALRQALDAAVAQRIPDEAASAATGLTYVVGVRQAQLEDGREWAALADAFSRATGREEARAAYFSTLGTLAWSARAHDEARSHHQRALSIRLAQLGPDHPDVANTLNNLGNVARSLADYPQARDDFERSLAILERALGPAHPRLTTTLTNLGNVADDLGDYPSARAYHERALAIREQTLGPEHPEVATVLNNLGVVALHEKHFEQARAYYERALAIWTKSLGPDHPNVASTLNNLGNVEMELEDHEGARARFEQAIAGFEGKLGPEHPVLAHPLTGLGEALLAAERPAEARPPLERALALLGEATGEALLLAETRFLLARALADDPAGDRARARALVELARSACVDNDEPDAATLLEQIDAWIGTQAPAVAEQSAGFAGR